MKIVLGTLKDKGDELATFLEPRLGTKLTVSGDSLEVEVGSIRAGVRPRNVKTYIKRFIFMKGVRKNYRVFVSGGELTIQEIELGKEEKEAKEEKEESEETPSEEEVAEAQEEEKPSDQNKEESLAAKAPEERKPQKKPSSKKKKPATKKRKTEPND